MDTSEIRPELRNVSKRPPFVTVLEARSSIKVEGNSRLQIFRESQPG
jgi:hypothetical protein